MAAKDNSSTLPSTEGGTIREESSDFTIILDSGEEVKCHKIKLAEASPVFRTMLKKDFVETHTSKMQMTEFDQETVESFLDYIYAEQRLIPDQDVYNRIFDKKRLTAELLRFCHMFDVTNLMEKCIEHLKKNVDDTNAVQVWTVAEAIGQKELRKVALEYLGRKKDKLLEVHGVRESFHSPQLVESLFNHLIHHPNQGEIVNVTVKCYSEEYKAHEFTKNIQMKKSDTVKTLKALLEESIRKDTVISPCWRVRRGSFRHDDRVSYFEENQTIRACWQVRCDVYL